MEYKDYYKTLGVDKNADEKAIKRAFRKLARQHHPDMNPGDPKSEERFKELNEAYEVLSDPEKRRKYDQLGADWQHFERSGGQPGDFDWSRWATTGTGQPGERVYVRYGTPEDLEGMFGGDSPFSDFFSQIFGGMGGSPGATRVQSRMPRRQDLEQPLEITLQEAFAGTKRILQREGQRLEVKIPAGVKTGTRVRVGGEGKTGDVYLRVTVLPDSRFERKEDDLHTAVSADLFTLVLGGEIRVPTLEGDVVLKVPAGTQNGRSFRLRGKGMPKLSQPEQRGDLYVKVEVKLPTELTAKQKQLFEELKRIADGTQ